MCNECNCEGIDLCSIIGYQPECACCPKCDSWDEEQSCKKGHITQTGRVADL